MFISITYNVEPVWIYIRAKFVNPGKLSAEELVCVVKQFEVFLGFRF